jgi:hypothetical protein
MKEHPDLRHIDRMVNMTREYKRGHKSLAAYIADMDFLLQFVEVLSPQWRSGMQSLLGDLEEVYAVNLDQGRGDHVDPAGAVFVAKTVSEISSLLDLAGQEGIGKE